MMYPYMTLADETEIVHSQIVEKDGMKKVIVNFERPTEDGFDSARCELPDYKWTERQGYSDEEIAMFEELLHSNAHLLYRYAENGGFKLPKLFMVCGYTVYFWSNENGEPIHVHISKVSLLQMRLKYGLQSQVDAFWQVMEVKFPRKS